jgi:bifunctional UDP-N-acetylglucosamine pyrophosphorylase/glucosamine-1-phosphate N-acetyltransferase
MTSLAVIILAAGQGTRMKSKKQKILHEVGGRPMVAHVLEAAEAVAIIPPLLVVAPGEDGMRELFGDRAEYVEQPEQLGTGHATMMAQPLLSGRSDQVLVTYGDMPLLRAETMARLAHKQAETASPVVMLSTLGDPSSTFGRVVRDENGQVIEIVEVTEAQQRANREALLAIPEHNAGVYCFDAPWLWKNLAHLPLRQARRGQEYYLTDTIGLAVEQGQEVETIIVEDPGECLGAGTRQEMIAVEKTFRQRANSRWLAAGITLVDPDSTYIDQSVTIGRDTIIWPGTYLQGETTVGEDCILGPNSIIRNARIGNGCQIEQAVVENVSLDDGTRIEPFSYITD